MSYFIGSRIPFTKRFAVAGVATDPTLIQFFLREQIDGTFLEWIYNAAPVAGTHYPLGMNPMVRGSAGNYSVAFDARKPEALIGFWRGTGTVNDSTQVTAFVRHVDIPAVDNP
jgi:hypothetical protein